MCLEHDNFFKARIEHPIALNLRFFFSTFYCHAPHLLIFNWVAPSWYFVDYIKIKQSYVNICLKIIQWHISASHILSCHTTFYPIVPPLYFLTRQIHYWLPVIKFDIYWHTTKSASDILDRHIERGGIIFGVTILHYIKPG